MRMAIPDAVVFFENRHPATRKSNGIFGLGSARSGIAAISPSSLVESRIFSSHSTVSIYTSDPRMSFQQQIREHLEITGLSMRRLSLQAGLHPKAVADVLNRPGARPNRSTLDALGSVIGRPLVCDLTRQTYAMLISELSQPCV